MSQTPEEIATEIVIGHGPLNREYRAAIADAIRAARREGAEAMRKQAAQIVWKMGRTEGEFDGKTAIHTAGWGRATAAAICAIPLPGDDKEPTHDAR